MKASYSLASVLIAAALSLPAMAQDNCSVTVDSTDAMKYDTNSIEISKSCEEFTINLTHSGKLPKTTMGHNVVITKAADQQPVATEGMQAGLNNNYVKPNDARVIAFTPVIGGGEETSVSFPVSKLAEGEAYKFFCSFPGHSFVMQGDVKLVP